MKPYLFISLLCLAGCDRSPSNLERIDSATGKDGTGHTFPIEAYKIPRGEFRGVLWPTSERKTFQIRVIKNRRDHLFDVPSPAGPMGGGKDLKDWSVDHVRLTPKNSTFRFSPGDSRGELELSLPVSPTPYRFYRLKSSAKNEEFLIFQNIAEGVDTEGVFGFLPVKLTDH